MSKETECRGGWRKVSSRLQGKEVIKSLEQKIGLKLHTRLYGQKSTRRYWDYSEAQPKELWWNISRLTARFCRPPWIWTLRMAATDWALSQRANANKTSSAYSTQLHNHAVKHGGESATRHGRVCIKQTLACLTFSCFKSNFCMKQDEPDYKLVQFKRAKQKTVM